MTFRWNVVCNPCYEVLDNTWGAASVKGIEFHLAGRSRGNRARWLNAEQYDEWLRKEAGKNFLGKLPVQIERVPELPDYIRNESDPVRKQVLFNELLAAGLRKIASEKKRQDGGCQERITDEAT